MKTMLFGQPGATVNINKPIAIIAAIYLGVIGPEVFIVQPGFVQGLVAYYGFDRLGSMVMMA